MRRRAHRPTTARTLAALAATAMLAGACGGSDDDDASSSSAPDNASIVPPSTTGDAAVVLRMGTDDGPGVPAADQIEHFAAEVADRSNGGLVIEPVWDAGGGDHPGWDQVIAEMVSSGELDLALVPARAWDTEGVTSLRALHAPFLVTSDELLDRVVADPVADEMLAGLAAAGVTGLALVPEGLRRIFSFGEPFVTVDDFDGAVVRAPLSATTNAALEALGASVDDYGGRSDEFAAGVADGTIAAAESSFAFAPSLPAPTSTTANVVLYPKVNVVVANEALLAGLDPGHREILEEAALATRDWAIEDNVADADLARDFCRFGGDVVVAADADVDAMRDAVAPVYAELERDAVTRDLIERIGALADDLGDVPTLDEGCGGAETVVTVPPPPEVTDGSAVSLTVETQVGLPTSEVVAADGAFAACTSVDELDADIRDLNTQVTLFSGQKRLVCPGGEVVIGYDVLNDGRQPGVSAGTWRIESSTLPGAAVGGGQLTGAVDGCAPASGAELCILDTYSGSVAPR